MKYANLLLSNSSRSANSSSSSCSSGSSVSSFVVTSLHMLLQNRLLKSQQSTILTASHKIVNHLKRLNLDT
jgi:hypothetical protein